MKRKSLVLKALLAVAPLTLVACTYYYNIMPIEKYGRFISKRVVWSIDTEEKVVALTFDDGPNPEYTPKFLDVLNEKGIKATFFVVGKHVEKNPVLAGRIHDEGHELANHSYSHPVLPFHTSGEIYTQIEKTSDAIESSTGIRPSIFRPPMGFFSPMLLDILEEGGYTSVIGDVYPRDPYKPGADVIANRVMKRVEPGSIIILHDGGNWGKVDRSQTLEAVPVIIDRLLAEGYRFMTVSELIKNGKVAS